MTTRPAPQTTKALLAATAVATLVLFYGADAVMAQRGERRGGGYEERDREGEERGGYDGSNQRQQPQDGENSYTTRRGGTVDTDDTTNGDTTTRDTTVTGADGRSADHTGSVTSDGDTTTYHGDTDTSSGRNSDAAAAGVKTDNGFVARGAGVDDHGAGTGAVVKDGDQVDGRSVTTNGDTVNRNAVNCVDGNCNRTTVSADAPVQYGAAVPYFVPYASYPCPGGTDMLPSTSGDIVYSCAVTPVVSTSVPLSGAAATSAQVSSSSVVMYQVSPDVVVYVTSYKPPGVYCEDVDGRCYWIPGVSTATPEVMDSLNAAAGMQQPTANATVITYSVGGNVIYFTGQPPSRGIYSQSANSLYAWMPGVTQPTDAQRDAITTSVTVHGQQGARALAEEARRPQPRAAGPS